MTSTHIDFERSEVRQSLLDFSKVIRTTRLARPNPDSFYRWSDCSNDHGTTRLTVDHWEDIKSAYMTSARDRYMQANFDLKFVEWVLGSIICWRRRASITTLIVIHGLKAIPCSMPAGRAPGWAGLENFTWSWCVPGCLRALQSRLSTTHFMRAARTRRHDEYIHDDYRWDINETTQKTWHD